MGIFDAIWRKRGRPNSQRESQTAAKQEPPAYKITMTERDYSNILEHGDVAIKCWAPDLLDTILNEMCTFANTTRSDLIRQTLFTYLYGRYDLCGSIERGIHHYHLNSIPLFCRSTEPDYEEAPNVMRDLGKNIEDIKVWIPLKMKEDLQQLADQTSITLSQMIREILISNLLGHSYLSARKDLLQMKIEIHEGEESGEY